MATVLDVVSFTYISLSVSATVCDALPVSTAELVVLSVSVALVVMWQSAIWFGDLVSGVIWSSCSSFELGTLSKLVYVIPTFCLSDSVLCHFFLGAGPSLGLVRVLALLSCPWTM